MFLQLCCCHLCVRVCFRLKGTLLIKKNVFFWALPKLPLSLSDWLREARELHKAERTHVPWTFVFVMNGVSVVRKGSLCTFPAHARSILPTATWQPHQVPGRSWAATCKTHRCKNHRYRRCSVKSCKCVQIWICIYAKLSQHYYDYLTNLKKVSLLWRMATLLCPWL